MSTMKGNLFTTYGTLRVGVVEASDLVENQLANTKKVKVTKSNVFAMLKITDENGKEERHCSTETHMFYPSEALILGEEFLFENVSSAHDLVVSFYSVALEREKVNHAPVIAAQTCLGFTQIPLARLGENTSIMQWHQLFSPTAGGLRSAVRIECNFTSTDSINKNASAMTVRRTGSVRHSSEYNANGSRGSMYFDDYIDEVVEDEEEEEDSEDSDDGNSSGFGSFTKKSDPERVFVPNLPVGPNGKTFGSPQKAAEAKTSSTAATAGSDEEKAQEDGADVKLLAGIIDYCVVLGPAEPFSLLRPSHTVAASGALVHTFSPVVGANANGTSATATSSSAATGVNSDASPLPSQTFLGMFNQDNSEEQEVIVWDRLPRQDHFDSELPSKLEWFACPEGSKTVLHHKRPDPYFQSFVLSSGGETEEVFGLSINFFIELSSYTVLHGQTAPEGNTNSHTASDSAPQTESAAPEDAEEDPAWWRRVRQIDPNVNLNQTDSWGDNFNYGISPRTECSTSGNSFGLSPRGRAEPEASAAGAVDKNKQKKLYTVVSLCVLFRASYHIQQLRRCLEYAYYDSILPHLCEWERQWAQKVQEKLDEARENNTLSASPTKPISTVAPPSPSHPHTEPMSGVDSPRSPHLGDILSSTFRTCFTPFSLHIERLMAILCLECPVPVPGFLSVQIQFPKQVKNNENAITSTGSELTITEESVVNSAGSAGQQGGGSPRKWKGIADSFYEQKSNDIDIYYSSNAGNTGNAGNAPGAQNGHSKESFHSTTSTTSSTRDAASRCVEFSAPPPEDFPRSPYPMQVLLKCFGPRVLIDIVCCVLSECRILFHSSDLSLLPVVCESLRTLIYPLQWTHVYLPVVPMHLLNVVEAPVPFMLGTHSKWLKYVQIEYMTDMVLVDCDTASIDMGGSLALQFPEKEDRWLMMGLKALLCPEVLHSNDRYQLYRGLGQLKTSNSNDSTSSSRSGYDNAEICETNTKIQLLFYDVLFHLLRYVPDCLFYLNPTCPVFNRPLFISDYASDEYRPALELITVTNCFHVLTESIHTPSLAFFYNHIARVSDLEKKLLDQTLANEENMRQSSNDLTSPGGVSNNNNASNNSITTPQSLQKGNVRRTGSGSGAKSKAFSRNVSVVNIIYDKLVSVSSPAQTLPSQGLSRQTGMKFSTGEGTDEAASSKNQLDSPKVLQHAGRGLMRHISILGMGLESKEIAPMRSFFNTSSASNLVQTESLNETAYSCLLPQWLLKPGVESASPTASVKVDSIKALLDARLRYYLPHLKAKPAHSESKISTPKGHHSNNNSHNEIQPKMLEDTHRSTSKEHVLTIQCAYAADRSALEAVREVASLLPSSLHLTPLDLNTTTPTSKSRVNLMLPRPGSAHQTLRAASMSNAAMSLSFKTPRAGSRHHLKNVKSNLSMKGSSNNMSLPVLNAVPSFRNPPATPPASAPLSPLSVASTSTVASNVNNSSFSNGTAGSPSPLPPSPLARLFSQQHNTIHEGHSDEDEDIGFSGVGLNDDHLSHDSGGKLRTFSHSAHQEDILSDAIVDGMQEESNHDEKVITVSENEDANLPEEGFSLQPLEPEVVELPVTRPLIEFDEALITAAQIQSKRWTVLDLAHACDVPSSVMLLNYSKMRSFANSKLCENTQFAVRHRAINTGNKQNNKRMLNAADTQATFDRFGKVGSQQCDECITMFLQKVVTESILEEHWLEDSVQRCIKALQEKSNRVSLIDMLKHAKQTKGKQQAASKVYPLNPAAFEAFSKLFSGVLRICSNQEDYLCAYGLLEVGGLYFRFIVRNDDETNDSEYAGDEIMEFLSERTCQHPIYHNSAMWCELMKSRVPVPAGVSGGLNTATTATTVPVKNARSVINTIMSEVHALLYIMLELEVNSARALLFIQGVASDYGLDINEYYKLKRSVNRIWANNHVDEVAAAHQAEQHATAHNLHKPDHIGVKKRSKENMRDRRASMSIGDMLSMQGHSTSKLFRQSSTESLHGRIGSMKMRASSIHGMMENTADGTARTPRGARRNSIGNMSTTTMVKSDSATAETDEEAANVTRTIRRTRSKSLHATKSALLTISLDAVEVGSFSHSGKHANSLALYPSIAATPMHTHVKPSKSPPGSEDKADTDDKAAQGPESPGGLSFSVHSGDNSLVRANRSSTSGSQQNLHYSDSDGPPSSRGDSSPTTPRMMENSILPGFFNAMMQPASESVVEDKGGLDEMLGLQRVSSAMLMRAPSMQSNALNATTDLCEAPKNLPNQFAPLELTGREEGQVTAFDCIDSWLVTGTSDGSINITDLTTGTCSTKYRHGSGSGDKYRGITALHCLPTLCPGAKTALFFTGCSNGIVKAWPIPTNSASAPQTPVDSHGNLSNTQPSSYWGFRMNLRLKNSIAVMKAHTAPITALVSRSLEAPAGWLLASGDEKGMVCLTRGSERSSSTTCCSTIIQANFSRPGATSSHSVTPSADTNVRKITQGSVLTGGKITISCLSFIGTPAVTTKEAVASKSKTGKKAGAAGVAVSAGVTSGVSTGTEEYLGVGTSTGLISVLDLTTATPIYQVAGHTARVTQLIGLRANEFISCSADRSIKLWDIRTRNRPTQNFAGKILEERCLGASDHRKCGASPITAIAVGGSDNSLVISTSADGVVRLWDRRYDVNVPCCVTQGHTNRITAIAWNGVNEFHTASHDGTVRTWDSINGQNTFMLQAFDEEGITNMKMTSFKCANHIMITPRGPVTFTDADKLSQRTCIVTSGWNGTIKSFVHDV